MAEHVITPEYGNWYSPRVLTVDGDKGVIDPMAQRVFTNGQCHTLALAIHEKTGWPIVLQATGDTNPRMQWEHALVQMPDGCLLDINGPVEPDELDDYHGDYLVPVEPDELRSFGTTFPEHEEIGEPFANAVLADLEDGNG